MRLMNTDTDKRTDEGADTPDKTTAESGALSPMDELDMKLIMARLCKASGLSHPFVAASLANGVTPFEALALLILHNDLQDIKTAISTNPAWD